MGNLFLESFGEVFFGIIGYGVLFILGFAGLGYLLNALFSSAEKTSEKSEGGCSFIFWVFVVVIAVVFFFMIAKGCDGSFSDFGSIRHSD